MPRHIVLNDPDSIIKTISKASCVILPSFASPTDEETVTNDATPFIHAILKNINHLPRLYTPISSTSTPYALPTKKHHNLARHPPKTALYTPLFGRSTTARDI